MWWVLDVHYEDDFARVAGIGLQDLSEDSGLEVTLVVDGAPAPYEPGQFYKRELPLLLALLAGREVAGVVVDGFVWLGPGRAGLGAHLHEALHLPVIGVAKRGFHGADAVAVPVLRGDSTRALWVTDIDVPDAGTLIREMPGPWRIPTVLKRVDQLCRGIAS